MNIIQYLPIRTKLLIVSALPVLGLLFYLQDKIRWELDNKNAVQQVMLDVSEIERLSALIHELQKERALTISYTTSESSLSKESLYAQHELTNKAASEFNRIVKSHNRSISSTWLLDSLSAIRVRTTAGRLTDEDDQLLTTGRLAMIEEINVILRASKSLSLKSRFEDHLFLLYTKDFLSQIRGSLSRAAINGEFNGQGYGKFSMSKGKYDIHLQKFEKLSTQDLKSFFEKKFQGLVLQQMNKMIQQAFESPGADKIHFTYDDWYATSTTNINLIKETEDFSLELIRKSAEEEMTAANGNVMRAIAVAVIVIVLVFFITVVTIRDIVNSIAEIKDAADRMARGNTDISLAIKSRDEIGNLAMSFGKMASVNKEFSLIAESIGRGDYSAVIEARGDNDILGKSLETMRSNLQKLSNDNFIRNWLLTGNSELNDKMRGEMDVKELAQKTVTQLATYMKAQIGAIYLRENGQLNLTGSYAFQHRKGNANAFNMGEGLVGQAALEKKLVVFSEVPENYVKINSALGSTAPKNIIVYPFLYENEVNGVIELGAAHEFTELDMQFLTMVGENIAIAINASQSRTKLKELLEETQRQAEELEAQQEELKQSNEELQEKTQLLEKSEAELKSQQEELQQSNEELEEKANLLEEQKEKLESTKMEIENKARELEAISRYKSEFLANMSHELRTPLNSILILSQLLAENKNNILGDKEVTFAKNINGSGTDLLNLINEILDLSKVEAGKMELDITETQLVELKSDMESSFSEIATDKSIHFNIQIADIPVETKLVSDKLRVEQILRNLLSNAFKFTPKGGDVLLKISPCPAAVVFRNGSRNHHDLIAFSVTDSGIGIPVEKQGIIFEAFQQADGSTKRKYGGTGLGLSICRELTNVLGGEIQLESEEGRGSTFTLYLPLRFNASTVSDDLHKVEMKQLERREARTAKVEELTASGMTAIDDRYTIHENDKKILIMEDDPDFANVLLEFVRERQYKGIIAYQGNTGLSFARHYKPDAIILDMKLPVMDGAEVLKQLKNDPSLRHIPVQIISGFDRRKEGLELGAFNYLRKPISKTVFQNAFDKIEDFMDRKLKKLLIVEDDKLQNTAIRELIGNGDVKCYSAYSGNKAFEIMKNEKFDCIIVDLGLPDMTGFELLEKIKTDSELNKIPAIVYTGKDLTKEENKRLDKLASTVVLKTADSKERLLDETTLFLHRIESKLPKDKQSIIRKLHKTDEVLHGKNVLVADDDMRNIYSLTNLLHEEGMNCFVAENGAVALSLLKENAAIDIVLMDVMMPEMDGYEATRQIRKQSKYEKLPVIALTAKAMKGDREKCLAAGMSDYISKPINIDQLISLMRVWLYK